MNYKEMNSYQTIDLGKCHAPLQSTISYRKKDNFLPRGRINHQPETYESLLWALVVMVYLCLSLISLAMPPWYYGQNLDIGPDQQFSKIFLGLWIARAMIYPQDAYTEFSLSAFPEYEHVALITKAFLLVGICFPFIVLGMYYCILYMSSSFKTWVKDNAFYSPWKLRLMLVGFSILGFLPGIFGMIYYTTATYHPHEIGLPYGCQVSRFVYMGWAGFVVMPLVIIIFLQAFFDRFVSSCTNE